MGYVQMNIYSVSDIGELIKDNSYVGRGIVVGKSKDGKKSCVCLFYHGQERKQPQPRL